MSSPRRTRAADTGASRARNPRGHGDRLRAALLDAAIEVLSEVQDVEALSVRAVTARAGVSPTALYLQFADKDELIVAVKEWCFAELRRYLLAAEAAAAPDPRRQAEAMCVAYLAFAAELPGHYRVLFHTRKEVGGPDRLPQRSNELGADAPARLEGGPSQSAEAFGDLVRAVERCVPDRPNPFEIATMVWSGLHGYATLRTMRHFPFAGVERYVTLLLDAYFGPA
jgi:AcrR family transcriptional regulator